MLIFVYSFALYPGHSWLGRGNLVIIHFVTHFSANSPEWRNENINLNKYFISLGVNRTHNQSRLKSYYVALSHNWPQLKKYIEFISISICYNIFHACFFALGYRIEYEHFTVIFKLSFISKIYLLNHFVFNIF